MFQLHVALESLFNWRWRETTSSLKDVVAFLALNYVGLSQKRGATVGPPLTPCLVLQWDSSLTFGYTWPQNSSYMYLETSKPKIATIALVMESTWGLGQWLKQCTFFKPYFGNWSQLHFAFAVSCGGTHSNTVLGMCYMVKHSTIPVLPPPGGTSFILTHILLS